MGRRELGATCCNILKIRIEPAMHSVKSVYTFFMEAIMGTPAFHYCADNVGGIVRGLCT